MSKLKVEDLGKSYDGNVILENISFAAEPGDSYNRIAGKHGMTVSELKALNPDQGDMIHIGDELVVQRPQTFLQVQVTRVVEYEKTLDYQTKKVQDSSQ